MISYIISNTQPTGAWDAQVKDCLLTILQGTVDVDFILHRLLQKCYNLEQYLQDSVPSEFAENLRNLLVQHVTHANEMVTQLRQDKDTRKLLSQWRKCARELSRICLMIGRHRTTKECEDDWQQYVSSCYQCMKHRINHNFGQEAQCFETNQAISQMLVCNMVRDIESGFFTHFSH